VKYLVLLLTALLAAGCGAAFISILVNENYLMFFPLAGACFITFFTGKLACSFS